MSTTHREFFGDAERNFRLTPKLIGELERLTGAGIGTLVQRVFRNEFSYSDVVETIRLALIGAGTSPQEAANLVRVYAGEDVPLMQVFPLAVSILQATYFGVDEAQTEEAPAA